MTQQAETIVSGGPNVITSTNTNVLTGGAGGVYIQAFTTANAPVYAPGVLYYDLTLGNLMIGSSNVSVGFTAVVTAA